MTKARSAACSICAWRNPACLPFVTCGITAKLHVYRVDQLQGSNTLLRSNLDRVTKERDEKQRSLQQLSTQQSGLSAFTAAEAQKEVTTLRHQLAFKAQEVTSACSPFFLAPFLVLPRCVWEAP